MDVRDFAAHHGIPLDPRVPEGVLDCPVRWNKRLRITLGVAYSQAGRPLAIDLNPILRGHERLSITFRHEVAHLCAPGARHGLAWQSWCYRLGIPPQRCYDRATAEALGVKRAPARHRYRCSKCSAEFGRRRRLDARALNEGRITHTGCGGRIVEALTVRT